MTDAELVTAIQADKQAAALAAAGNDAGCAARLNAILPPLPARYLPWSAVAYFGATRGILYRLQDASQKAGAFAAISDAARSIALTYFYVSTDPNSPGLDTLDPVIVGATASGAYVRGTGTPIVTPGLLDAMVATGILNDSGPGGKEDLLAQTPSTPQATVTGSDVGRALLPGRLAAQAQAQGAH